MSKEENLPRPMMTCLGGSAEVKVSAKQFRAMVKALGLGKGSWLNVDRVLKRLRRVIQSTGVLG